MDVEPDGIAFEPATVTAEHITEDADYEGVRVTFTRISNRPKIPMQIDIGFGDVITPFRSKPPTPRSSNLPAPLAHLSQGNGGRREIRSDGETGSPTAA